MPNTATLYQWLKDSEFDDSEDEYWCFEELLETYTDDTEVYPIEVI